MVHALGLVDDGLFATLETIRAIRNEFAHSFIPLGFDTSEIKELCLTLPKSDQHKWPDGTAMGEERTRFVGSCLALAIILSELTKRHQGHLRPWLEPFERPAKKP